MEKRREKMSILRDETGAVAIVEATFVFPIMFFVLFFIMMMGNIYYQQARIDDIVSRYAIIGAEKVTNPLRDNLEEGKTMITDSEQVDAEPYRYLFGSMKTIEDEIQNEVYKEIISKGFTFMGNAPEVKRSQVKSDYKNHVLYGDFVVEASYQIKFPIKFIGSDNLMIFKASSCSQASVTDVPEFVRNVDFACDILNGTSFAAKVKDIFQKVNDLINKFK